MIKTNLIIMIHSNEVLQRSNGIEETTMLNWRLALLLALSWIIVFLVLIKGVQSLGKVSRYNIDFIVSVSNKHVLG